MLWNTRILLLHPLFLSRAGHNKEISKSLALALLAPRSFIPDSTSKIIPGWRGVGGGWGGGWKRGCCVIYHVLRSSIPPVPCPYSAIHLRLSVGPRLQSIGGSAIGKEGGGGGRRRLAGKKSSGKVNIKGLFSNCFRRRLVLHAEFGFRSSSKLCASMSICLPNF